jgi:hypothetical protein
MSWVRWRTNRSRVRNTKAAACCRSLFTATNARALRRFANRLGIVRVVFLPLHKRLYIGGWDQPKLGDIQTDYDSL